MQRLTASSRARRDRTAVITDHLAESETVSPKFRRMCQETKNRSRMLALQKIREGGSRTRLTEGRKESEFSSPNATAGTKMPGLIQFSMRGMMLDTATGSNPTGALGNADLPISPASEAGTALHQHLFTPSPTLWAARGALRDKAKRQSLPPKVRKPFCDLKGIVTSRCRI